MGACFQNVSLISLSKIIYRQSIQDALEKGYFVKTVRIRKNKVNYQ